MSTWRNIHILAGGREVVFDSTHQLVETPDNEIWINDREGQIVAEFKAWDGWFFCSAEGPVLRDGCRVVKGAE